MALSASPGQLRQRDGLCLREGRSLRNPYYGVLLILIVVSRHGAFRVHQRPGIADRCVQARRRPPDPTPAPVVMKSGSLFDTGKLQWFEYRLTPAGDDKTDVSDVRFDYTTTTINGITVKDNRITMKMTSPDMEVVMDKYYDPASNSQVGSRVKTLSGGATLSGLGIQASDLYSSNNIVDTYVTGNWPLKSMGTDVVTIDGNSYSCTKYSVGETGESGTAWVSEGVPVPVKIEIISPGRGTSTWELIGRG